MGVLKSSRRLIQAERRRVDLAGATPAGPGYATGYSSKVLGYNPIAYWPLWEASGTVAACQINAAQNGTYSSDVSTWPVGTGMGDGNTAPAFDGTNDYVNVFSAALATAFNADLGSASLWVQIDLAVWNDGVKRHALQLANNDVPNEWNYLSKHNNVGGFWWDSRRDNGGDHHATPANAKPVTWLHWALTWTVAGNALNSYRNGALVSGPIVGLQAWDAALTIAVIGAQTTAPALPTQGPIAHCALFDAVLTAPQIADLATV